MNRTPSLGRQTARDQAVKVDYGPGSLQQRRSDRFSRPWIRQVVVIGSASFVKLPTISSRIGLIPEALGPSCARTFAINWSSGPRAAATILASIERPAGDIEA